MPALIETLTDDVPSSPTVEARSTRLANRLRSRKGGPVLDQLAARAGGTSFRIEPINGEPGIVTLVDGVVRNVVTFDFTDSAISAIYIVVNPDKLGRSPRPYPALDQQKTKRVDDVDLVTKGDRSGNCVC